MNGQEFIFRGTVAQLCAAIHAYKQHSGYRGVPGPFTPIDHFQFLVPSGSDFGAGVPYAHVRFSTRFSEFWANITAHQPELRKTVVTVEFPKIAYGGYELATFEMAWDGLYRYLTRHGYFAEPQVPAEQIRERIFASTLIVESPLTQGTCFHLRDVGILTCSHVLPADDAELEVFRADAPTVKFAASVDKRSNDLDLAILASEITLEEGLAPGSAESAEVGNTVYLAGFPNYRNGDTGVFKQGSVTGFRTVSAIRRLLIDASIVAGNSGGPVTNANGAVIGIAVTGSDREESADRTEDHGVIPISALSHLFDVPMTPMAIELRNKKGRPSR